MMVRSLRALPLCALQCAQARYWIPIPSGIWAGPWHTTWGGLGHDFDEIGTLGSPPSSRILYVHRDLAGQDPHGDAITLYLLVPHTTRSVIFVVLWFLTVAQLRESVHAFNGVCAVDRRRTVERARLRLQVCTRIRSPPRHELRGVWRGLPCSLDLQVGV